MYMSRSYEVAYSSTDYTSPEAGFPASTAGAGKPASCRLGRDEVFADRHSDVQQLLVLISSRPDRHLYLNAHGIQILSSLEAVRGYPPPAFPPSQMWHVMTEAMKGVYEVRVRNRNTLHRLFCILDATAGDHGLRGPALVLVSGGTKPVGRAMASDVYRDVVEYRDRTPVPSPGQYSRR
jgi:hypothetical protein